MAGGHGHDGEAGSGSGDGSHRRRHLHGGYHHSFRLEDVRSGDCVERGGWN